MRFVRGFLLIIGTVTIAVVFLWLVIGHSDNSTPAGIPDRLDEPTLQAPEPKPHAGCILRGGAAAVCRSGVAAVMAFQRYGADPHALQQSYAQAVLQDAGCFVITNSGPAIRELSQGKVALSDGWVGVTMISVGPGGGVIADSYLDGKCEPYTPVTTTLAPQSNAPDFSIPSDEPPSAPEQSSHPRSDSNKVEPSTAQ